MPTYADDILTALISERTFPENIIAKDIDPKIKYHEGAKEVGSSLFAMQGRDVARKPVISTKFFVYEKEPQTEYMELAADINDSVTTITVDDVGPLKVDDIVQFWSADLTTCEQMLVLTVPGPTSFTVTRAYGTSSATSWPAGQKIKIQFNASDEESSLPEIKNIIPSEEWNCITLTRTPMGGGLLFYESKFYTGDPKTDQRIEKWIVHTTQRVNRALFAERKFDTTYGRPVGEGLIPAILRRGGPHDAIGGTVSYDRFLTTMELAFKYGSNTKIGLFPPIMLSALAYWKRQNMVVMNEDEYLNLRINRVELPGGNTLKVIKERKLSGDPDAPRSLFGSSFVVFDPAHVHYCPFLNYGEKLLLNRQANDALSTKDEYLSIDGFRWDVITAHLLATGVIGYN